MSKFFARLSYKKLEYCVWLTDFQVFSPSKDQYCTYGDLALDCKRGKARLTIHPVKKGDGIDPKSVISPDN
jgi:hypothetical protein